MEKYKVCFVAGSRADYGIVRRYIALLNLDENIDFAILATGALLSEKYGHAEDLIIQDGFKIDYAYQVHLRNEKLSDTTHVMADVLEAFGDYFQNHQYDLVIILGDRYEIFSVAIAAAMHHQPILHIHGGEVTLANYDEFIRHSITKMSRYHFTSTEEYRKRVIQLGESPSTVFNLGALGAENCLFIDEANIPDIIKKIEPKTCFTVLFHPETLNEQSPWKQVQQVLSAVESYIDRYDFYFIGSNADTGSDQIRQEIKTFCKVHKKAMYVENLHPDAYHELVKKSLALVGNSSSGIIEVPSLGSYTINIGNRQTGRVKGNSIIDVACQTSLIKEALMFVIQHKNKQIDTPYYRSNSAELYYKTTKKILAHVRNLNYKDFYDIP